MASFYGDTFCTLVIADSTVLKTSWNSGRSNLPDATGLTLNNQDVNLEDGILTCKFTLTPQFTVQPANNAEVAYDLIKNDYHILVARGDAKNDGNLDYHSVGRRASGEPTSLKSFSQLPPASNGWVKAHGIIMVFAWLACAATGEGEHYSI